MLTIRRGYSLLEALVSVTVSVLVLVLFAAVSARQQRFTREVIVSVERSVEMNQLAGLLPIALRSLSPRDGDIAAGGARDTSLEFRATIATAVVCDTAPGAIRLAPSHATPPALSSLLSRPEAGDTVWSLSLSAPDVWTPRPITAVADSVFACRIGGSVQWPSDPPASGLVLRLGGTSAVSPGSPVRVTRPWRYSLYHSSDNYWYVGAKDWNPATAKFNTIQPVSGPYLSAASRGMTLRYYDSTHAAIASGAADTHAIALIEISVRSDTTLPGRFAHLMSVGGTVVGSVALRNR